MISFVCSVGNVPLAAVLWNGGISFGGVISFIFADLVILPILNIYRKYYGGRISLYLLAVSYVAMAIAGFVIGLVFQALGVAPTHHPVQVFESRAEWNYTMFLDIGFLALAAVLGLRFLRTGGPAMLRMMEVSPEEKDETAVDPVCGMPVDAATTKYRVERGGATHYFCSAGCRSAFEKDPDRYSRPG
jgi:uncharacterized protein